VIGFSLIMLLPGDPALALLGEDVASDPERYAAYRSELGLDQPIPVQYARWIGRVLSGDLGTSIRNKQPVTEALRQRLPATLELMLVGILFALTIALPLGILSALRPGSRLDSLATLLALSGVAIPSFWLGIMLIYLFSVWLRVLPPSGYVPFAQDPVANLTRMIMPGLAVSTWIAASLMRQIRASLIEVLHADYITTARAKGLSQAYVVLRHALKNALVPVLTVLGLHMGRLFGGTVIVEVIFSIPGIGRLIADSIFFRDFPVGQAAVLVAAIGVLGTNLLTDILYAYVDPRIRYS
jgi:peptide/nickel transport system permease protein